LSRLREPANALTHLAGSLLSAGALVALVGIGWGTGNRLAFLGLGIYGVSQLGLYTASTLFHALRLSPAGSERLLRLDCALVFVFIAGTYTPVCLIALHHGWRWGLLGAVWGLALGGMILKLSWMHAPVLLSTGLYVALGWVALAALPALVHAVPPMALGWFVAGGVVYTLGALIFLLDRAWPWPGVVEMHALWHLSVLGGSGCFFWAIVHYIVPLA
jgi:hemolysin III